MPEVVRADCSLESCRVDGSREHAAAPVTPRVVVPDTAVSARKDERAVVRPALGKAPLAQIGGEWAEKAHSSPLARLRRLQHSQCDSAFDQNRPLPDVAPNEGKRFAGPETGVRQDRNENRVALAPPGSFDGDPVSDVFPAAIAFHFFALRIGTDIYQPIFDGYRAALRGESSEERPTFVVEQGLTRGGYRAHFLVGTEQTMPHVVFRVQMFGEFIWRVHWPLMQSSTLLPSDGIGLDIAAKTVAHLPERPEREQPIALPAES